MKQKLSFQLFKNDKPIINSRGVNYHQQGKIIEFILDKEKYKLEYSEEICYLCRYTDEFSFTISLKSDIKTINYMLIKENQDINLSYKYLEYEFQDNEINIYFNLESDEKDSHIRILKEEDYNEK